MIYQAISPYYRQLQSPKPQNHLDLKTKSHISRSDFFLKMYKILYTFHFKFLFPVPDFPENTN